MIYVVTFDRPVCRRFEHVSQFPEGEPRPFCRINARSEAEAIRVARDRHPEATPTGAREVEVGQGSVPPRAGARPRGHR